mgnify:CR=1 FL=1
MPTVNHIEVFEPNHGEAVLRANQGDLQNPQTLVIKFADAQQHDGGPQLNQNYTVTYSQGGLPFNGNFVCRSNHTNGFVNYTFVSN